MVHAVNELHRAPLARGICLVPEEKLSRSDRPSLFYRARYPARLNDPKEVPAQETDADRAYRELRQRLQVLELQSISDAQLTKMVSRSEEGFMLDVPNSGPLADAVRDTVVAVERRNAERLNKRERVTEDSAQLIDRTKPLKLVFGAPFQIGTIAYQMKQGGTSFL